jgi:hypothetical protein
MNIKAMIQKQKKELEHLQKQRTKANKKRKAYWQKRIDTHFGLA